MEVKVQHVNPSEVDRKKIFPFSARFSIKTDRVFRLLAMNSYRASAPLPPNVFKRVPSGTKN